MGPAGRKKKRKKAAQAQAVEARHRAEQERRTAEEERAKKQKLVAEGQVCSGQTSAYVKAEARLAGTLNVGLNFKEYSKLLSDVSVAYQEVPFKKMTLNCLNAAIGAEDALKAFESANTTWETCQQETECSQESIKPKLQKEWATATADYERAKESLEAFSAGTEPPANAK